ncbi:MAG: hypothetical protein VR64_22275 [Desulfatitalea sp. BRH_c12]|nr:MAG: hypothetical protein VR64_22275 [Desulfatitalea sp. BRH_c12]
MTSNKRPPGLTMIGNNDPAVSQYLKAWIKQGRICVCGVIGEGASKDIQVNWNSPFEQDTVGSKFEKVASMVQIKTGQTSKGKLASEQVWEGNRPHTFNLPLRFYALSNAKKEVMDALCELEKMLSPEVGTYFGGPVPQPVSINIGRSAIYSNCVITNMSTPLSGGRTKEGYLVRAEITLQIETKQMLNRSEIERTYR